MISFLRYSFTLLLFFLLLPLLLRAQVPVTIAPNIGYEYGAPLGLQRAPGVINRFGISGDGRSYNHTEWFGAEITFPGLLGDAVDLVARPTLALSNGRFTSDPFSTFGAINRFSREQAFGAARFEVSSTESAFVGDLRANLHLGNLLRIGGGVWGGYRIASAFFQTEELLDPSFVVFPDDSRFRTVASGNQLASVPFRGGAIITVGADIRIAPWLRLRPELHTRVDAGALLAGVGLRSVSGGISMSIEIGGGRSSDTIVRNPIPTITAAEALRQRIAELPPPSVAVDLYCIENGERRDSCSIRSRQVRHRQFVHFPDRIQFDHDSAILPAYLAPLSPAQSIDFSMHSLAGLPPDSLRAHALNILGIRLRRNSSAHISIVGIRRSDEQPSIARQRAVSVRNYLQGRWGIEGERISLGTAKQPEERGCVEIRSTEEKLIAPIGTAWIESDYTLPHVGIERAINAPGGVKHSELRVSQGNTELLRTTESDAGREKLDLSFPKPEAEKMPPPIVAVVSVGDYGERTVAAQDELYLLLDTTAEEERDVTTWIRPVALPPESAARDMAWMLATIPPLTRLGARIDILYPDSTAASQAQMIAQQLLTTLGNTGVAAEELRVLPNADSHDITIAIEQRGNSRGEAVEP